MDYYLPIRVMIPIGQPNGGTFADVWQHVVDGKQQRIVTLEGLEITLPEIHEAYVLDKTQHFAPGVVTDPNAAPTISIPLAELVAAIRDGTSAELIASKLASSGVPLLPGEVAEAAEAGKE